ncbi:MAG: hypothetical protein HOO91_20735 [Bacteroidales bacterium]|nr:hypothetical protein [Bacteroidales bacterium]
MKNLKLDRLTSNRFDVNELIKIKGGILICACQPMHPCYCRSFDDASDTAANNEFSRFNVRTAD